jgi:hypothetical protein
MSKKSRIIIILFSLFIIICSIVFIINKNNHGYTVASGQATNFSEFGVLSFRPSNNEENIFPDPYLFYGEEGRPSLSVKLVMDETSVCAGENGSLPCIAMSVSLDIPFNNKSATVEGIQIDENTIMVRKLRVYEVNENPLLPVSKGLVYITWEQARQHIKSCEATTVMQTHSLNVILTLTYGNKVVAVEPTIDEVMGVVSLAQKTCGTIIIATE